MFGFDVDYSPHKAIVCTTNVVCNNMGKSVAIVTLSKFENTYRLLRFELT